jgi:hypothetical protein
LYLTEYERLFNKYRDQPIRLLEIGIQNGGSLEIWSKYFINATAIVGCDINPDCASLSYEDPRISVILGDANATKVLEIILGSSQQFDIIIDDGSHRSSDIIRTFTLYFPHLVEGGIFIAEDLHCSYWKQFEGGLFDPYSSITFFKRLADVINHEHWGVPKAREEILYGIFSKYGCELDTETLSKVHSVEFINSMCVFRKAMESENVLGVQIISGTEEAVVPGRRLLDGTQYKLEPTFYQSSNPWSTRTPPPDEALEDTEQRLVNAEQRLVNAVQQVDKLNHEAAERDKYIVKLNYQLAELNRQLDRYIQTIKKRNNQIAAMRTSTSWRLTAPLRWVKTAYARKNKKVPITSPNTENISYANYIARMEPKDEDLEAMANALPSFNYRPKFSIVVPV